MGMYLEENENAKDINKMSLSFKMPVVAKKKTTHQILVDRILEVSGQDNKQYAFWCKKVNESRLSMNGVLDLCDKASKLDSKYNKAGFIRNRM